MPKLALGTVQFGLDYGISNPRGRVPLDEVRRILDTAESGGIKVVDTAADYGECESVLGQYLPGSISVITKTGRFVEPELTDASIATFRARVAESLARLRRDRLYGLLVHYCEDLVKPGGARLFAALEELKVDRVVERIGISAYRRDQIEPLMERYRFDLVQVPLNVLDQRLTGSNFLHAVKAAGVEVHVRSVFLQGLLFLDPEEVRPYFAPIRPLLRAYHDALRRRGLTPVEGALAFVKSCAEVDYVVVGTTGAAELSEVLGAWNSTRGNDFDFTPFAVAEDAMVNPARWAHA